MSPGPTRFAPDHGRARGQTSLDFLIGLGVFLGTVGFVAVFATNVVTPFADDQSGALVVERTTDELVGVTLAGEAGTNRLDETCTLAFFGVTGFSDAGCPFESVDPLTYTYAGIEDRWDLRITVERNDPAAGQEIWCVDANGDLLSCTDGGTSLALGDQPDFGSGAVLTTVRVAVFDDRDVAVVVRLW